MLTITDLKPRYYRLLTTFNLLIGILAVIFFMLFVRDILSAFSRRTARPIQRVLASKSVSRNFHEYDLILKNNPFGFPAGRLEPISSPEGSAVSRSDITLIGTVAGPEKYSYAVFLEKDGKQDVFRIGAPVFGIGKLRSVEKDRVLIDGGAGRIEMKIADILAIKEGNPAADSPGISDFARSAGNDMFIVNQQEILHALDNPTQLMTNARLQPNIVNGRQEGFVLREVKRGGIYQNLGLHDGDVLLRINNYNISNPENALQAFTALRGMDRVQLDIVRNGSKMTLTYQIR